jgi:hypothetical protein
MVGSGLSRRAGLFLRLRRHQLAYAAGARRVQECTAAGIGSVIAQIQRWIESEVSVFVVGA